MTVLGFAKDLAYVANDYPLRSLTFSTYISVLGLASTVWFWLRYSWIDGADFQVCRHIRSHYSIDKSTLSGSSSRPVSRVYVLLARFPGPIPVFICRHSVLATIPWPDCIYSLAGVGRNCDLCDWVSDDWAVLGVQYLLASREDWGSYAHRVSLHVALSA